MNQSQSQDEFKERLERVYAAIGETVSRDPAKMEPTIRRETGRILITFDGGLSPAEIKNKGMQAVDQVAFLSNHMKKWARQNGKDPDDVDSAFNASQSLKIVTDLSNADKHAGHDRQGGHSGQRPEIVDFTRALRMTGGSQTPAMTIFPAAGGMIQGDASIVINGRVRDSKGNHIGELTDILSDALHALEDVLDRWRTSK